MDFTKSRTNSYTILKSLSFMVAVILTLSLIACQPSPPEEEPEAEETVLDQIDQEHNARNSLDYDGTYEGVIPGPESEEIEIQIELHRDGTFIKRTDYIGKENDELETFATYSWNEEGNIIALQLIDGHEKYFVAENKLIKLDEEGEFFTGEKAEDYVLRKQQVTNQ